MINFFTFKWGAKYDEKYVNRLYGSLLKNVKVPFKLTCITDNSLNIHKDIEIIDYDSFDRWSYPKDRVFTREKVVLFKRFNKGKNFLLDLDILIQDDITDLVQQDLQRPTFIWNYWNWDDNKEKSLEFFGGCSMCYVNSSFVGWQDNNAEFIYDHLDNNKEKAFYTYKSLDKYIFYQMYRTDKIDFWSPGIFYNYNFDDFKHQYKKGYKASIFNTSHIKANNIQGVEALEIDEAEGWAKELWEGYDLDG